jgi:hypothetical protein
MEYEVLQSVAWVTLGFLPMLGSMELAWRLSKKGKSKKDMIKKVPAHAMLQK